MEQKFVLAKNYNQATDFVLDSYIDAKDTVNHWCVGQISDVEEEKMQIKVHFEGWTNRYDEWIKKNSQRIAPFRRHTEGYTGQKKNAYRDFKINYTQHNFILNKVKEIREKNFQCFETPQKLTQFLRGELYFYIDSLISLFGSTNIEDLPAIQDFLQEVFKLALKWMEIFPQYLKAFNENMQHPNLYLVDMDAAISQCGPEFFSILEKCFGLCQRCMKFFQKFNQEYLVDGTFANKEKVKQQGFMLSLLNAFGNMQGFQQILDFIQFEIKDPKTKNNVKGCPFILTMKALKPFTAVLEISDRAFVAQFAGEVKKALLYRFDNLTDNEIKELDKEILRQTIEVLKEYVYIIDPQNSYQVAELYELKIAEKYLRCPFFEKRVRGINDLKDIYYKVMNAQKSKQIIESQNLEFTRWLSAQNYGKWVIQQRIIDFIFVENPHAELINRSQELLRLLCLDESLFSPDIIDHMWSCCKEKHEDIVRATFDLIQELAPILPLDRLSQTHEKIKQIKDQDYDEKTVIFLRNYTINAMKNLRGKKNENKGNALTNLVGRNANKNAQKIDDKLFYDPIKFWFVIQDQNKVSSKVKDLALNSLIDILQECERETKEQYIALALENIKKGDSFYNSLIFLRKILNTYPLDSQVRYKSNQNVTTVSQILGEIFKKFELFDYIFAGSQNYMKQSLLQKDLKSSQQQMSQSSLSQSMILNQINHEDFIKVIMSFIEFVLVNSKINLIYEHVEIMYKMFVLQAKTEFETNAFFNLLTKENETAKSKERRFLMDDKVRYEVFSKIFCNNTLLNCETINYQGFLCFKKLFLIINEEEKHLEVQREERISVINLNALLGMDTIWAIAIQSQNKMVKENCKDFLVDIYLRTKIKSNNQKKQITESFTSKCLQYFKNSHDRGDHQLNCLRLIKTFISRFDGDHIIEEDIASYDQKDIRQISCTLNPDKLTNIIKVHPNQKLWQLKRLMANVFKLKLSEFYIKTKQGPLEEHIYDDQIKDYQIQQVHIQRVTQEEMEKEFPRYLIGYNADYTQVFIELLQSGTEESKREVLSLLESLPINIESKIYIQDKIITGLNFDSQPNQWNEIFFWKGKDLAQTVYFLMGLEDLMIPKREVANQETIQLELQTKSEFCLKFMQKNGFNFLVNLLNVLPKNDLEKDTIRTKALTIIIRLIVHLFGGKQSSVQIKQSTNSLVMETLFNQILDIISSYILTIKAQQLNGIPQQDERNTRSLKNDTQILHYSYQFILKLIALNPTIVNTLYNFTGIEQIFRAALIDIETESIQKTTTETIFEICNKIEHNSQIAIKPSFFFMKMFIKDCLQHSLQQGGTKTRSFFELISRIFISTEVHQQLNQIQPIEQLVQNLTDMILQRDIIEISARDEDVPLSGLFNLLKNILDKFPQIRENYKDKNRILKYLIHEGLFHKETKGQLISKEKAMPPKCKNSNTRDNCLKLLHVLCQNNPDGLSLLIRYLKAYICETFWRTPRKADWQISVHQQERSLTGFVGLKNIGCICYMNSIMQQLFMISSFRKALLEVEDPFQGKEPNEENVLFQLKMIFGGLMEVEKQYYNPKRFCFAFKELDGSPIDPLVQKDVDEFFNMLMDRIENIIRGKKEEKIIRNLFQGVFANEFICKGCPHYSEREEPFQAIILQVKNKHSIKESLDSFVEGEMLEGDNAYYCEKCEKKINTLKRCCIKRMPNVLILVLKRFEFNFDTMTKFKINDYIEFPMQLNMSDYSQENLTKKDLIKQMEEKNLTLQDLSDDQKVIFQKQIPQKYYDYNLKGTVIHIGTAEQGHYYSFIEDRDSAKWYEFNDTLVKEFDPADIPHEAFGGEDEQVSQNIQNMQTQQTGNTDQGMIQAMKQFKTKIKNAYVLIYEREDIIDMEKFNEYMDDPNISTNKNEMIFRYDQCKLPKVMNSQTYIPPMVHDSILEKNKKFWLSKFIFNKSYIDSILNIFKEIQIDEDYDYGKSRQVDLQSYDKGQFELFKFLTTFFLTTVIRAKERKSVPYYMKYIRDALKRNVPLSVWLIETFSNQNLIKELLIDSPIPDMKRFVAGLLGSAMQTVYPFEQKQILEYTNLTDQDQLSFIRKTQGQFIKQERVIDSRQTTPKNEYYGSQCQELQLISLKHHNSDLPSLLILINAIIHQSISLHNMKNQPYCGQFYMIFSHFAELGDASRLYLLKNKTVGRLLDIFFNIENRQNNPQIIQKFRNESLINLPLFLIEKDLYIQCNAEMGDVLIHPAERKMVLPTLVNWYSFLLYSVSVLTRSCMFVKVQQKSPFANDDLLHVLDSDEIAMLINHSHEQWWNNCEVKISRNAIALMYAHICFENKEFSLQYLSTLLNLLQRYTFDRLKIVERPLLKMLQIQDTYQLDRVKKTQTILMDIMKISTQFYKEMDSLVELVYKLTSRIPAFADLLGKNQPLMRLIEQWQKDNPYFPLNQQKTKVFKQGIIQWNNLKPNFINQATLDKVQVYSKDRLMKLQKLIQKDQPISDKQYDSDDDMYHHQFQEKERIDFLDNQETWNTGYVDIALDEMIKCISTSQATSSGNPLTIWIETESDKLAPPDTQNFSEKRKMYGFYLSLLKHISPSQN